MNCSLCGEVCRCPSEPLPAAIEQRDAEAAAGVAVAVGDQVHAQTQGVQTQDVQTQDAQTEDASAWRDELSARVNRYRARRKVRPPRYPSLRLQFGELDWSTRAKATDESALVPAFDSVSNHALALDEMRQGPCAAAETDIENGQVPAAPVAPPSVHPPAAHLAGRTLGNPSGHPSGSSVRAKIIEFPRLAWGPPPPPPDQLAEPVSERPRILEVPEVAPPLPALGGITIEAAEQEEAEKRPGIDIPLQSAPLGLRVLAALVDGLIIAAASALFGFIFWKVAAVRPPLLQILGLAAGIPCLFWATYQYLLIVYAASTPGLRVAGLELTRFDGTSTTRALRRWRALAGCLSGLSLGMGYAWVFLDEDALCWHDRITHTYLAPGKRAQTTTTPSGK
jgi:uncharacterized RDD family membrane protein YckC